ncbi:MAG: multicopper oxidase domain-containing protein [Acidobacteria bacterium]|nr:multicopper oxidase domain-containing protein [Acidobacteriota bacterium]
MKNKNKETRRQFLQWSALAGASFALPWDATTRVAFGQAAALPLDPRTLRKYADPLPRPAKLTGTFHTIAMTEFRQKLHAQLPLTTVWGYNGSYPGPTIEAVRGVPIQVLWRNQLSTQTLLSRLPVDQTLHWADPLNQHPTPAPYTGPVPTVTHLHGGETEPQSDGHPDAWFTPNFAIRGMGWVKDVYSYANAQAASTLWYHDHALGVTRLNVYAGLAGFYLLRDPQFESTLNLPSGNYEREIVIQDRTFDVNGQLMYPSAGVNPTIHPYWVPEFFGNTIVVNGKVWPFMQVEPRKYRLRLLNGSNARFYNLKLSNGRPFIQIGTDGGYLSRPVQVNQLLLAPGERADVIVDFTGHKANSTILMNNDARAPFPNGAPADPQTVGQIMQFRIVPLTAPDTSSVPASLSTIPTLGPISVTRTLTLNEIMGAGGPLAVILDGKEWMTPITERPRVGTTELWQIVNMTADTHPIHLHLVQFQLLSRQRFQAGKYMKDYMALNPVIPAPVTTNPPINQYLQDGVMSPAPNELGWKDTVRMNPGEVTRILVRFAPTTGGTFPFAPQAAPGYVWHCHILEHEDNEMMRPYQIV